MIGLALFDHAKQEFAVMSEADLVMPAGAHGAGGVPDCISCGPAEGLETNVDREHLSVVRARRRAETDDGEHVFRKRCVRAVAILDPWRASRQRLRRLFAELAAHQRSVVPTSCALRCPGRGTRRFFSLQFTAANEQCVRVSFGADDTLRRHTGSQAILADSPRPGLEEMTREQAGRNLGLKRAASSLALAVGSCNRPRTDRSILMAASQSAGERELAELIVNALNLEGVQPADIDPEAPLFKTGLGLDSID